MLIYPLDPLQELGRGKPVERGGLTSPNASSTAEFKCPRIASPVPCAAARAEWAFCAKPTLLGVWCVVVVVVVVWVGAVVVERGVWVG